MKSCEWSTRYLIQISFITPDIFILKMTRALWRQNTFTLNDLRPLAPKYSEYFTGSAPPTLYSWSYFTIGCSSSFYSRSASLIRSAYLFLYINFCFRFNKLLTNLTLLRQHHLQYSLVYLYLRDGHNKLGHLIIMGLKDMPITYALTYWVNS